MPESERWVIRKGAAARNGWESVIDESTPGWAHTGVRIGNLSEGVELELSETKIERLLIPLSGSFTVIHSIDGANTVTALRGRESVFAGRTDVLFLSAETTGTIAGEGRVAVATSPTSERRTTRYIPAEETPIELRGAGASSRQVHAYGMSHTLDAARLVVCEVITPANNWSSYPPHKHDELIPGHEARLEEIYYFESAPLRGSTADPDAAFGLFSSYSSPAGDIDINAVVRTGDIAIIPYGYHGPAVAAPGYDLYYLNVMAGPDPERAWLATDDPQHAWVRDLWQNESVDGRLPFD